MRNLTKEEILNLTDNGWDIIAEIYPDAIRDNKPFKIREERTASASAKLIDGVWYITDFGADSKGRNCFDIVIQEIAGVHDFKDAIRWISENILNGYNFNASRKNKKTKAAPEADVANEYELAFKNFDEYDLDLLGLDIETCNAANVRCLASYTLNKIKDGKIIHSWTFESSSENPMFVFDYTPEAKDKIWKIYKPRAADKRYKFVFTGPRPDIVYGWNLLPESCEDIFIVAGEKDVLNMYRRGFHAITLNSETAELKGTLYKELKKKAKNILVCYDLDKTGQAKSESLCDFYKTIINVKLPDELLKHYDFRGNPCKDITDYFRHYNKEDFLQLISLSQSDHEKKIVKLHGFYSIKKDRYGEYGGIIIQKDALIELLMSFGFYSYDINEDTARFIHIEKNLIKGTNRKAVVKAFMDYIRKIPKMTHKWDTNGTQKEKEIGYKIIKKTLFNNFALLFNMDLMLNTMIPAEDIEIKSDDKAAKYLYYRNGFVSINAEGRRFYSYNHLDKYIWREQILERDYIKIEKPKILERGSVQGDIENYLDGEGISVFEKFVWDITRLLIDDGGIYDWDRFHSLQTIIGYNLHNYMKTKLFATVLTDARMSDDGEPNGRTGKDLLTEFCGKMLNANERSMVFTLVSGKDFKLGNKHRYEMCGMETQLIALSDLYQNFNLEIIFPDITSGVSVNKKNDKPFTIFPKIMLSTNKTIRVEGESAKDRVIQFELSDHYNSDHSPYTKFGHWFGPEWDEDEWHRFDNFMIWCIEEYFLQLKAEPKTIGIYRADAINIRERTLREHTSREFVAWFTERSSELESGVDYYKKDMFEEFTGQYDDYKNDPRFRQATLTTWINAYVRAFPEVFAKVESKRNGTKGDSFVFTRANGSEAVMPAEKKEVKDLPF